MAIVNERQTQTPSSSREGAEMRAKTRDCRNVIRRLETCWLIADEFSFRLDHQQGKKMEKSGRKQNMRFCFHSIPLGFNLPPPGTGTATAHCTLYLVDNDHPASQPSARHSSWTQLQLQNSRVAHLGTFHMRNALKESLFPLQFPFRLIKTVSQWSEWSYLIAYQTHRPQLIG